MQTKLIRYDAGLSPYEAELMRRAERAEQKKRELCGDKSLRDFANGYLWFGLRQDEKGVVYREWAPGADELHLIGDFNGWDRASHPLSRRSDGVFELRFPEGARAPRNGEHLKVLVTKNGQSFERIPAYAYRVVQDPDNFIWSMEAYFPEPYPWTDEGFAAVSRKSRFSGAPLIYECHIGMAQEEGRVGTYREFRDLVLPRIREAGYNTIQLMAVQEHPYYASFGYQVTNFFAVSSRFGTPEDLKSLIDRAHSMKLRVLLDVVHSHAASNTAEGLNRFDGTECQYFHEGPRGNHPAWGTKLFDYGKNEVLHFLLSNLKFFMEEYHFDGFRFDGVTSMLYRDHGLGTAFTSYDRYFSANTDTDALTYLTLANTLVHEISPFALTAAEDVSGMPGMCVPVKDGGIGFDYRLSMGAPDLWIRTLTEKRDGQWELQRMYHELTDRRPGEKTIGYAESHDQALVGDKTLMFRLCDAAMYTHMSIFSPPDPVIDRGMALHRMIRLMTFSLAGEGYLNFCGNEFGHPEWIDFPREGNGWSYQYCRRQWSLEDDRDLKYHYLSDFDRAMLSLQKKENILRKKAELLYVHETDQVLAYAKGELLFVFNFHPDRSLPGYSVPVKLPGEYVELMNTDGERFGGFGRTDPRTVYLAEAIRKDRIGFTIYLPSRTGIVYKRKKQ